MRFLVSFVLVIFSVAHAHAANMSNALLLEANVFYTTETYESTPEGGQTTVEASNKRAIYDIKFGKIFSKGWYLGGIYTSRSNSALNASGTGGSALGVSGGYMGASGFFAMIHYLFQANNETMTKGSGIQIDGGYKVEVSNNLLFGAELTQRMITYTEDSSGDKTKRKVTEMLPMVSLGYLF